MSIFHYKAILQEVTPSGDYIYTFYPDYVMAEEVTGTFCIRPDEFKATIIIPANAEEKGLVSMDSHCVKRLADRIKLAYEKTGKMPQEETSIS